MAKIIMMAMLLPSLLLASITKDSFWKEINYGWVCPDSMDLTEETIFSNTNKIQIGTTSMIELMLGLHERCLACNVTPRNQVETFSELIYTNAIAGTNLVDILLTKSITKTNAIGYYVDSTPFRSDAGGGVGYVTPCPFDFYLLSAIPKYGTTNIYDGTTNIYDGASNTVYDGTTNMVLYAPTNLFEELELDWVFSWWPEYKSGTLAIVPSFGTNVFTNFHICYTQYNASFSAVTQEYLAPSSQYVNYAYSYSVTNGITNLLYTNKWLGTLYVVSFTNYPWYHKEGHLGKSVMELWLALGGGTYWEYYSYGTIDKWARFEEYGYFYDRFNIYREVFFDRYKILNALQYTAVPPYSYTGFSRTVTMSSNDTDMAGLKMLKANAVAAFTSAPIAEAQTPYAYAQVTRSGTAPTNLNWTVTLKRSYGIWKTGYVNTNIAHGKPQAYIRGGRLSSALWTFTNQGDTVNSMSSYMPSAESVENDVRTNYTIIVGTESLPAPTDWPDTPTNNATWTKGYSTDATDRKVVIKWNFLYCTNKYW